MQRPTLLGRHNPRLSKLRRIVRRQIDGLTVVDGPKLVVEMARCHVEIVELYGTADTLAELANEDLPGYTVAVDNVFEIEPETMEHVAPTKHSQGLLAVVRVREQRPPATGVVLYLAGVQDPGNVGAAIRSAAAFGAGGVYCDAESADPFSPRAVRGSAGHSLLLPVSTGVPLADAAAEFEAAGGEVVVTTGRGGLPLPLWRPRPPVLLLLGNEGHGLNEEELHEHWQKVTVPLRRGVESLNVGVAAGVILAALSGLATSPILK